jgi:hypothetical protein
LSQIALGKPKSIFIELRWNERKKNAHMDAIVEKKERTRETNIVE